MNFSTWGAMKNKKRDAVSGFSYEFAFLILGIISRTPVYVKITGF
jgi:hypothetical protein